MQNDEEYTVVYENDAQNGSNEASEDTITNDPVTTQTETFSTPTPTPESTDTASLANVPLLGDPAGEVVDEVTDVVDNAALLLAIQQNTTGVYLVHDELISVNENLGTIHDTIVDVREAMTVLSHGIENRLDFCVFALFCLVVFTVTRAFVRSVHVR